MKVNKEELSSILGTTKEGLKTLERRNKLENKLKQQGYKLINKTKESKRIFYTIEKVDENKGIYNNLCKYVFKTNKPDLFQIFYKIRTIASKNNTICNNKDIAILTNVSVNTVSKWTNTLVSKKILHKDGYYYFCIENINNHKTIKQITEYEYKSYWRNKRQDKIYKDLKRKYMEGKITLDELMLTAEGLGACRMFTENKYCYKVKKYLLNEENQLYIDTLKLINAIYYNDKEFKLQLL